MIISKNINNPLLMQITIILICYLIGNFMGKFVKIYSFFYPFRFDTALTMLLFIWLGNFLKPVIQKIRSENYKKNIVILILLLLMNLIAFKYNTTVSVSSSEYGNIFLFLVGAVFGSYFIIVLCKILSEVLISIKYISKILDIYSLFGREFLFIM